MPSTKENWHTEYRQNPKRHKKFRILRAIETPDAKNSHYQIARPALKNQLFANLFRLQLFRKEARSAHRQATRLRRREQDRINLQVSIGSKRRCRWRFNEYWEGAPNIPKVQVKTLSDANALQAELKSNIVDLAPGVINLSPDTSKVSSGCKFAGFKFTARIFNISVSTRKPRL